MQLGGVWAQDVSVLEAGVLGHDSNEVDCSEVTTMRGGVDMMQTTAPFSTDALVFALDVL